MSNEIEVVNEEEQATVAEERTPEAEVRPVQVAALVAMVGNGGRMLGVEVAWSQGMNMTDAAAVLTALLQQGHDAHWVLKQVGRIQPVKQDA